MKHISKIFNKKEKENKDTSIANKNNYNNFLLGIEIETCFNLDIINNNFLYFKKTADASIKCPIKENVKPVEFVSNILSFSDFEVGTKFNQELITILSNSKGCLINQKKNISCGTHIHISNKTIDKKNYPNFDKIILYLWITKYQDIFKEKYYKYQNRENNPTCKLNYFPKNPKKYTSKYMLLNTKPSYITNKRYKLTDFWHFEFRGMGEIINREKILKDYIKEIIIFWENTIILYNTQYQNIIDKMKIT